MSELISRQKLIEALTEWRNSMNRDYLADVYARATVEDVIEYIESQPPADQWIPFTGEYDKKEGRVVLTCPIPDDDEEIMVTDGKYVWEDTFMNDGQDCWLDGSNKFLVEEVTAWMPKPEPYKGAESID
jgi:hypothetical protein